MGTVPFALCGYSLPHVMGYLATKDGVKPEAPLDPLGLMQAAKELGLIGVEFGLSSQVPSFDGAIVETGRKTSDLREYLKTAQEAGAKTVRAVLSHILCGDRRNFAGGWDAHRDALAKRLQEVIPYAEELGVCLAVENHQDATSDDLLWLAEQVNHSPAFGVTLDAGNPLAVGEEPIAYTQAIASIIRHIHLKDYKVYLAPEGYRLVRCSAGQGAIPFPEMLAIVAQNGHDVLPAIEVAAQATRTIPVNEVEWWAHYPVEQRAKYEAVTPFLEKHALPMDAPYSSAWERGESSAEVIAEEWLVVRESVAYFASIA
ncbi:MAG: TIM barrel protein [Armatimonadetes bacterium]|nr:TIM barrel protein [Armatimonadota bacterium]